MPDPVNYPGTYIQEVPRGVRTIVGVPTSIAAFFGRANDGPVNEPVRLSSFVDFQRNFGQPVTESDLATAVRLFFSNGGRECYIVRVAGPDKASYLGSESDHTGLYALDKVDLFNLMIIPYERLMSDADAKSLWAPASMYCKTHLAFLLVDPPYTWWTDSSQPCHPDGIGSLRIGTAKEYCAVFYPRIMVDKDGCRQYVGPVGAIAGLMARTDTNRGVWKAPAGIEATLNDVMSMEIQLSDVERDILNKEGINCLKKVSGNIVNWGSRTMSGDERSSSEWKYIPVRRLALFIEESLFRGTQWVVFEPNDEPLWSQIRLNVSAFMHNLFTKGAFQGNSPKDAYFVKCDKETITQNDINRGIVNIIVGFAPLKPDEFIVIKIQQIVGQIQT